MSGDSRFEFPSSAEECAGSRESDCCGAPHLRRITQPSLVVQSLADTGVFPNDARTIYESFGADDKQLELIAGDHYLLDPPGAREGVADLIAGWLAERGA